jgi:hypothetical protein
MDLFTFSAFLDFFSRAPEMDPKTKIQIDCTAKSTWVDNKPTPGPLLAKVFVGKDERGVIFLSVVDAQNPTRPMIKFDVLVPNREKYHSFHVNGQPMSIEQESAAYTRGVAGVLKALVPVLTNAEYEPPQYNKDGGGKKSYSGGNNWNKGNQNQRNNNNNWENKNPSSGNTSSNTSSDDNGFTDDDIPF